MTDWSAVITGFVIEVLAGLLAFGAPGIGHAIAGLIGGFVAGYLAGGGLGNGAWHGLLAGALGGLIIAVLLGLGATLIASVGLGPLGPLVGGTVFLAAVFVATLLAVDSAIAGAVGGVLGD